MKKILFLDFDGVLVTDRYQMQLLDDGVQLHVDEYGARFDPVCVENLRRIIDSNDADIVIPSTWKMRLGLEGLQKMWDARRLPGKVIGVTPAVLFRSSSGKSSCRTCSRLTNGQDSMKRQRRRL